MSMHHEPLLNRAILFADQAHQGQRDKAGQPYIRHPMRVMNQVKSLDAKVVAILHDTLEDTRVGLLDLHHLGLNALQLHAIIALSKQQGESRFDVLKRTLSHPLACYVKYADIYDNINLRRLPRITHRDLQRYQSYALIAKILANACTFYQALDNLPASDHSQSLFKTSILTCAVRLSQHTDY